jgi:RimK family alpha-L-glutamate ligase
MSKKILIIFGKKTDPYVFKAFAEQLKSVAVVEKASFAQAAFFLEPNRCRIIFNQKYNLADYDLVYFRSMAHYRLEYQSILALYPNLPVLQSIPFGNGSNKLYLYCAFAREKLPFPKSVFINDRNLETYLEVLESSFNYPFVAKQVNGSLGKNVFLVNSRQELEALIYQTKDFDYNLLFQEFIPNTYDLRVIVIEGRVVCIIKRERQKNTGEWRNNTSLGAKRLILDVAKASQRVKRLAIKAAKALDYTIAGVDIVIDQNSGKAILLEVNSIPSFKPGTADAIIDYVLTRLNRVK